MRGVCYQLVTTIAALAVKMDTLHHNRNHYHHPLFTTSFGLLVLLMISLTNVHGEPLNHRHHSISTTQVSSGDQKDAHSTSSQLTVEEEEEEEEEEEDPYQGLQLERPPTVATLTSSSSSSTSDSNSLHRQPSAGSGSSSEDKQSNGHPGAFAGSSGSGGSSKSPEDLSGDGGTSASGHSLADLVTSTFGSGGSSKSSENLSGDGGTSASGQSLTDLITSTTLSSAEESGGRSAVSILGKDPGAYDLTGDVGVVLSREVSSGATPTETNEEQEGEDDDDGGSSVRRSRETKPVQEEQDGNMEDLVRSLQNQLADSQRDQANARSMLLTLEEQQATQARDLSNLKAELSALRQQQGRHHAALEQVRVSSSDTTWALKDLKASTEQLQADLAEMKNTGKLGDGDVEAATWTDGNNQDYTGLLKRLDADVHHLKTSFKADRIVIARAKRLLTDLDWASKEMKTSHTHENRIPLGSGDSDDNMGSGGSGNFKPGLEGLLGGARTKEVEDDDAMETFAEKIVELHKTKEHVNMRMENLNKRFVQYDTEMSKVYTMYYNLSLQLMALENKLLTRDHAGVTADMAHLQSLFVNFTQQVFTTEQLHMSSKSQLNATLQNEQRIRDLLTSAERQQAQIDALERLLADHRATNDDLREELDDGLTEVNETVVSVRGRFREHKSRTTMTFSEVTQHLNTMRKELRRHNSRLLQVEVKTLNESLSQCRKNNEDIRQNINIDQLRKDVRRIDAKSADHSGLISRHDRTLNAIYKEVQGNNQLVGEVMTRSKVLFDLVPRTTTLEDEINKMLMHLPKDCTAPLAENSNKPGLYLIKPAGSVGSLVVNCEADSTTGSPWLVVQRREDGTESFARTWAEYQQGFGTPEGDFWIGNDNLHKLTNQDQYRLHIDMWDLAGKYYSVQYDYFRVDGAAANYRLVVDGYHGNATDALRYSNYMPFSTIDRDNDVSSTHCAKFYTSGWWYKHCHYSNLNGRYTVGVVWFNHDIDEWIQMRRTVMKIQPVSVKVVEEEETELQGSGSVL